jgi:hypothetical protein
MKLPAHNGGASRKGNFILIVPLDCAYPALAGRGTCRSKSDISSSNASFGPSRPICYVNGNLDMSQKVPKSGIPGE